MNKLILSFVLAGLFSVNAHAASKPLTQTDMIKAWLGALGKEFKKVKSKDAFITYTDFADRAIDSLEATGLQAGSTVFSSLDASLQTALSRLKTDIDDIKTKRSDVNKLISNLAKDMKTAASSGTPPTIQSAQVLIFLAYNAVADGEINDKEREALTAAGAAVTGTAGLSATLVSSISADVNAIIASRGVTKTDLDLLKTDLASIASILKGLP